MAEAPSKRPRQEGEEEAGEAGAKRHCLQPRSSYHHILSSFLEEAPEEVAAAQDDLSSLITSLQQELASSAVDHPFSPSEAGEGFTHGQVSQQQFLLEEDEAELVMRLLLEASDDDLGIPSRGEEEEEGPVVATDEREREREREREGEGERELVTYDEVGFGEMEDVAASYYELLQSELSL